MTRAPTARPIVACALVALALPMARPTRASAQAPAAVAHGNVTPAGVLRGGVLSLRLVAQPARWHPEAEDGPAIDVEALGEETVR